LHDDARSRNADAFGIDLNGKLDPRIEHHGGDDDQDRGKGRGRQNDPQNPYDQ
jgi:hypothetical protein